MTAPKSDNGNIAFQVRIPKQLSESIDHHRGKVSRSNYVRAAIADGILRDSGALIMPGAMLTDAKVEELQAKFAQTSGTSQVIHGAFDDDVPISLDDNEPPPEAWLTAERIERTDGTGEEIHGYATPEHPAVTSKLDLSSSDEETKPRLRLVTDCLHPENRRANYGAGPICTACGQRL